MLAATLMFISLLSGIAATRWQAYRAQQQQALAEKRFNQVRELANNVIFKYHDEIKDLPGATKVRAMLVQDALLYLDNLQSDATGNADLTRDLAQSYLRVASVQGGAYQANLGDSKGAAASYEQGIRLLEPIVINSHETKLLAALRDAYIDSSRTFYRIGEINKQNENLQRAYRLSERIVQLDPDHIEPKISHAKSLVYFADSLPASEMPQKMEHYRHSVTLAEEILKQFPADETAHRLLGTATHRMQMYSFLNAEDARKSGDSARQKTLLAEALVYAVRSTTVMQKVLAMKPDNALIQRNVAGGKLNEGKIYRALGDTGAAVRLATEALKIQQPLAATDANNQEIKLDLQESYQDLALAYIQGGQLLLPQTTFRKSVVLNEQLLEKDPENFDFWIARLRGEQIFADALLAQGERALAQQVYEKALSLADSKTPRKFAEFSDKFQQEVRASLQQCIRP